MIWIALGLGIVTAVANILGGCLAVLRPQPSRGFMAGALGFSGGFVLAAALLEMIPESLHGGEWVPAFVLLGYLIVFLIEQFLNVHLHHLPEGSDSSQVPAATGLAAFVAFNTHDFIDGLAIGAGMVHGAALGTAVFLAVLFHEVPAGFAIAAIMRGAGWSRPAAIMAGASIGFITLVGIVLPFWIARIEPFWVEPLVALAAGTFIYLGATLLIPLSEAGRSRNITFLVALGCVVFFLSNWLAREFLGH